MMTLKKITLQLMMLIHAGATLVLAQSTEQIRPLANGDTMPDLRFTDVFNHSADTLRLSDYRGKWVILDFWGIHCVPCLKSFPKLDSLQREYGERIQLIAVNSLGHAQVDSFFRRFPNVYVPDIPFITGDSVLHQLFPHQGNPHVVWINHMGKILHQSDDLYLTRGRLDLALTDKPTGIPETPYKGTYLPTLLDTNYTDEITHGSYLARWNTQKRYRISYPNQSNVFTASGDAKRLFQDLYRHLDGIDFDLFQPQRVRLETQRSAVLELPKHLAREANNAWHNSHMYYFQIRVPPADSSQLFLWAKSDLERYFRLTSTVDTLWLDTWVLEQNSTFDKLRSRNGKPENTFIKQYITAPPLGTERRLINQPYDLFSSRLTRMIEQITQQPCTDETGYSGNVDITFQGETMDRPTFEQIEMELTRYDLRLRRVKKALPVLVLRDNQ